MSSAAIENTTLVNSDHVRSRINSFAEAPEVSTSHAGSPEEHGAGDTHFHNVCLEEGDTFLESVVLRVNITKKRV